MGPLIDLSLYGGGRQAIQAAPLGTLVDKAISFQHTLADQLAHFLADASPTEAFHAVEHAVVTAGLQHFSVSPQARGRKQPSWSPMALFLVRRKLTLAREMAARRYFLPDPTIDEELKHTYDEALQDACCCFQARKTCANMEALANTACGSLGPADGLPGGPSIGSVCSSPRPHCTKCSNGCPLPTQERGDGGDWTSDVSTVPW